MSEQTVITKAELLAAIDQGWNAFQSYLASLGYEQVTIPTDAAGWTVKDHLVHLAVWEDGINALLDKQPRPERMGLTPEQFESGDYDAMNEVIRQRHKDMPLQELAGMFFGVHERLVEKIKGLTDEDLKRPYRDYQPGSTDERPVIGRIMGNTYLHYEEHTPWIAAIAAQREVSVANLLKSVQQGWDSLNTYLDSLSDSQHTQYTDAKGWTVKDHAIHLAIWERGISAVLDRVDMVAAMGVDAETWKNDNPDGVNAIIQRRYKDLSWAEIDKLRREIHRRLIEQVSAMADADLQRPYKEYRAASTSETPIVAYIVGNTFAHYNDHLPWMQAIAESGT